MQNRESRLQSLESNLGPVFSCRVLSGIVMIMAGCFFRILCSFSQQIDFISLPPHSLYMITAVNGHTKKKQECRKGNRAICDLCTVINRCVCVCVPRKAQKTPDIQTLHPLVLLFFSYESCKKKVVDVGCLTSRTVLELNELCFVVVFCI